MFNTLQWRKKALDVFKTFLLKPIRGRLGVQTDQALYLSLRNIYYLDFDTCVWKDLIKSIFVKILTGSINGQLSAQPTNEVAYVKFALDTETVLTSEEKELLPFFTHFFLSMGAGSKSYREMDTAMELHTGSMGASIHMYVTIII